MLAIVAAWAAAQIAVGERIPVANGLGWDGVRYAAMTRDTPRLVHDREINTFYLQRVLPCLVIHGALRVLGVPLADGAIVTAFAVMNAGLLVVSAWLWAGIARERRLGPKGRWLGFFALFVNVAAARMPFYYPTLTDTAALCLGLLTWYAWLTRRGSLLLLAAVLGAFTWPTVLYVAAILLAFPRGGSPPGPGPARGGATLIGLAAGMAVFVAAAWRNFGTANTILGVAALAMFAGLAEWGIAASVDLPRAAASLRGAARVGGLLTGLAMVAVTAVVVRYFASEAPALGPINYMNQALYYGAVRPAVFLVGHVVYFGPFVLAAAILWRHVCEEARALGWGPLLVLALTALQATDGESRRLVNAYPLVALLAVLALERRGVARREIVVLGLAAVAFSKIWLPFNGRPLFERPGGLENYFMNHGPSMTAASYAVQGAIVVLTLLGLALLLRPRGVAAS
jgi:hypothetical protein